MRSIRYLVVGVGGFFVLLIIMGIIGYFYLGQDMPEAAPSTKAEDLTDKMLRSLNYEGYVNLSAISWTFRDNHHYQWNKDEGVVKVTWEDAVVRLDFGTKNHQVLENHDGESKDELIAKARELFFNDSFWLVAPFKIRDKGTQRSYIKTDNGDDAILVTYQSGGITPGDSYLWILDENHRPKAWRLWTSNVPIPGLKFGWTDWQMHEGVWFAPTHPGPGPLSIDITNLTVE